MANSPLGEIEDLTLCSYCKRQFDDNEQLPKLLACKHHFCLKCVSTVLLKGRELYCVHCWKRTELGEMRVESLPTHAAVLALARRLGAGGLPPEPPSHAKPPDKRKHKAENCHTHAMPFTLWCHTCGAQMCRACAAHPDHAAHLVKPHVDAKQILRSDLQAELAHMHKMLQELQHLVFKQRDFLVKILEACTTLKTQVEMELINNLPGFELADARDCLDRARRGFTATETQNPAEIHSLLVSLSSEKERLQAKHQEMILQCKLDDLIRNAGVPFDFDLLKQALANIHSGEMSVQSNNGYHNPILFLANYCMSQLYSRHYLMKQQQNNNQYPHSLNGGAEYPTTSHSTFLPLVVPSGVKPHLYPEALLKSGYNPELLNNNTLPNLSLSKPSPVNYADGPLNSPKSIMPYHTEALSMALPNLIPPGAAMLSHVHSNLASPQGPLVQPPLVLQHSPQSIVRNPSSHVYPVFYFNIEVNGNPFGRILIEVRNDVAPKMAKNFTILTTGDLGIGYKGCNIFQCWENESIITGDFELNNGRGGRSIFEESFFMPDDTKILAVRGSVGMRRSQKRHDNLGLVGSQFRIILREMRGFTGIFAYVVEGIELVDRISQTGDSAGKPQSNVAIVSCGKLN